MNQVSLKGMGVAQGEIMGVILAAGRSLRMGRPKLLLPWGETTILGRTIATLRATTLDDLLLVTGANREQIAAIAADAGVKTVHNPGFANHDLLFSLQLAVRHLLPRRPAAVLVMLADLPFLPSTVIEAVLAEFREGKGKIVVPVFAGRRGHPVCFGAGVFNDLLDLPPSGMPRDLVQARASDVVEVPVDSEAILRDIDWPQDYEHWRPPEVG